MKVWADEASVRLCRVAKVAHKLKLVRKVVVVQAEAVHVEPLATPVAPNERRVAAHFALHVRRVLVPADAPRVPNHPVVIRVRHCTGGGGWGEGWETVEWEE